MSFQVITARLNGSIADNAVLNSALSLSKTFGGHIDALFARPDPRMIVASIEDGVYPSFYEDMLAQVEREWTEIANKALRNFDRWRSVAKIRELQKPDGSSAPSAEWRDAVGTASETIGRSGRVSDIIVTAMPARKVEPLYDFSFEAALLDSGRPVLLVPAGIDLEAASAKVIVAWNGSPEAFHAVSAAMPILARAEEVLVFTGAEGNVTEDMAQKLLDYLSWHGVRASRLAIDGGKENSIEERLLAGVKNSKATLLVMGAYTHSRFRELIFGGVTRHVLNQAAVAVLMAH